MGLEEEFKKMRVYERQSEAAYISILKENIKDFEGIVVSCDENRIITVRSTNSLHSHNEIIAAIQAGLSKINMKMEDNIRVILNENI